MPETSSHYLVSQTPRGRFRRPSVRRFLLLFAGSLLATGCEVPQFRGPQVQAPPSGFIKKADVLQSGSRMFPDRPTIHFDAWIETEWGEFTGIYINGHEGSTTLEEVVAAREWSMDNPTDHPMDYGNIETVHIDGRTGWAWMEMWRENGLHEVRYHVAIPYDTVTYAIDFFTGDPRFKARPDSIRAIVATFAVGRVEWNWTLLTISTVLGALLLRSGWSKLTRRPYEHLRDMQLVELPVKDGEDAPAEGQIQPPPDLPEIDGAL